MRTRSRLKLSLCTVAALFCFFIGAALRVDSPSEQTPLLFYSNQQRQDLPYTLRTIFQNATRSIHLTMYAVTDPSLIAALQKRAEAGIAVEVFFDPSASEGRLPFPIKSTPVKCRGLMHRKIVVIDEEIVFLGSANFTTASLSLHDNFTCGLYHKGLAQFLLADPHGSYSFSIGSQKATLWLLPDKTGEALRSLLKAIEEASDSISISMFTLTHPQLVEALILAHKKGVKVSLAVDYYAGRGASKKALDRLRAAGIHLGLSGGSQLLHHKWAYIDHKTLIVGSTNWTKAAFTKNQDCLLFLNDLTPVQKKYMDRLWRVIELEAYN